MDCIIYLFGAAGAGKFTIGQEICKLHPSLKLVHNHHINYVILELVNPDGKSKLPRFVWDNITKVRSAVLDTIRETDANSGYIFTNVLVEEDPEAAEVYGQIRELAADKGLRFLPVRLSIGTAELCRRAVSPVRHAMLKDVSLENARDFSKQWTVYTPREEPYLALDVTDLSAETAARAICRWIDEQT